MKKKKCKLNSSKMKPRIRMRDYYFYTISSTKQILKKILTLNLIILLHNHYVIHDQDAAYFVSCSSNSKATNQQISSCDYSQANDDCLKSLEAFNGTINQQESASYNDYPALLDYDQANIDSLIDSTSFPQVAATSNQRDRLLWRRQVSSESLHSDNIDSLVADYDFFRPIEASAYSPAPPDSSLSNLDGLILESSQNSGRISAAPLTSGFMQQHFAFDHQQQQQQQSQQKILLPSRMFEQQQATSSVNIINSKATNQKIGPQFITEPPGFIHYLNSAELVVHCSASGNPLPTITWWHRGAQLEIGSLLDKRYVRYDNSLVISAFKAHEFEPETHSTTYKCQASNSLGTIISRDVVINAVIDQEYEISVGDQFVTVDNDALFRCQIPPQMRDLLQVVGWLEDGQHLIQQPILTNSNSNPTTLTNLGAAGGGFDSSVGLSNWNNQQQQQLITALVNRPPGGAIILPDGQLYIQRVQLKDGNKSYRCQVKNVLNSKVTLSTLSGRLFVTDSNEQSGSAPRIIDGPKPITYVRLKNEQQSQLANILLTCLAQGSPRPTMRWFEQKSSSDSSDWSEISSMNINNETSSSTTSVHKQQQQQNNNNNNYVISNDGNLLLIKQIQLSSQQQHSNSYRKGVLSSLTNSNHQMNRVDGASFSKKFKCFANNSIGQHQMETEVRVEMMPQAKTVELEQNVLYINNADLQRQQQTLLLNCTIRSSSLPLISIEWLKNGRQIFSISLPQFINNNSNRPGGSSLNHQPTTTNEFLLANNYYYGNGIGNGNNNINNNNFSTFTGLLDSLNQELSAIEYYPLSFDNNNTNNNMFEQQQQQRNENLHELNSLDLNEDPSPYSSELLIQQQQQQSNLIETGNYYIVTQTNLLKLSGNMENNNNQAFSQQQATEDDDGKFRRLKQRIVFLSSTNNNNNNNGRLNLPIDSSSIVYQLQINKVRRSDRGSYQCRAKNVKTTIQATANLMLKDNPPEFVETFPNQLLNTKQILTGTTNNNNILAGSATSTSPTGPNQLSSSAGLPQAASLKCVASGSPLPEISWLLSGFPIPESSRFRVGDYVTRDGLIVSFVNITNVQSEDGGLYECSATNDVGQLRHSAWLNVTGLPVIRPMPNVSAVGGNSLSIMCPVGGWPIESISWFHNATKLPVNHRQKIFPNGTLLINDLNEVTDNGLYTCQAKAPNLNSLMSTNDLIATNSVQVFIKVPPILEPFSFAKTLHRGQRYNIMCTVVHGDLPVTIRWFKDGRPLDNIIVEQQQLAAASAAATTTTTINNNNNVEQKSTTNGIAIKHLDPYSSTLTFSSLQSHHRGVYSCEATNEAGRVNQSSPLIIHVPPEWRIEPKDLSVTVGRTAVIDCQADALPAARIEWRISQDSFREPPTEFRPIISSLYMRVFENGSLIIYNTQRTDAGYYLCQANNGVGPGLSRVIKLTVHVAAHFKSKIRTEVVRRGQSVKLKCESIGDLPIEINWLKDKMPLYGNDEPRYSINKLMLQDGIVSELNIIDLDRIDSALFTCITQNQYGNDDTNIQLIVQGPPDQPQDIRIHEYEARSVKISWSPPYSGNSPISKYIIMYAQSSPIILVQQSSQQQQLDGQQQSAITTSTSITSSLQSQQQQYVNVSINGNESSILLQNLIPLTEYQFYMFAINSIGSSRIANEPIKFRTDDEAPAAPPLFVKAQATSSRTIRVRWRAPERRAHYGAITGFYVGYKHIGSSSTSISDSSSTSGSNQQQYYQQQSRAILIGSLGQQQQTSGAASTQLVPISTTPSTSDTFIYKTVEYISNNNNNDINMTNKSGGYLEQECLLAALKRGQKYLIIVQAFNNRGAGPASEPIITDTWRVDVPEPPILRLISRTIHSIHLAWRLPQYYNTAQLISSGSSTLAPSTVSMNNVAGLQQDTTNNVSSIMPTASARQAHGAILRKNINDHMKNYHQQLALLSSSNPIMSSGSERDKVDLFSQEQILNSDVQKELGVDNNAQANEPILGFILTRKQMLPINVNNNDNQQQQQPIEIRLPSDHMSQIVDNLICGTRYQFTIAAINSVGTSAQSDPLIVKTEGSTPVAPDKSLLLSMNASSVLINLASWHNGACQMKSFDLAFKASRSKKWTPLTNYQVAPTATTTIQSNNVANFQSSNKLSDLLEQKNNSYEKVREIPAPNGPSLSGQQGALIQQQQQALSSVNNTSTMIVLDDLSSALNYDLKIVATNEAGSTEALYTFNTNNGLIVGPNGNNNNNNFNVRGGSDDLQWANSGQFQLSETNLSDIITNNSYILPAILIMFILSSTFVCILIIKRRHPASSNCSLTLSSASRSNQSSSNYYTTTVGGTSANNIGDSQLISKTLNPRCLTTNQSINNQHHSNTLQHKLLSYNNLGNNSLNGTELGNENRLLQPNFQSNNTIRLSEIYGNHHQPVSLDNTNNHMMLPDDNKNSNYAYLAAGASASASNQLNRPSSPQNTDMGSIINGSEVEMCLGASALNLAASGNNQQQQQHDLDGIDLVNKQQRGGDLEAHKNYYLTGQLNLLSKQQQNISQFNNKSSTLPINCQHQVLQQMFQQQQNNESNNQQQIIDTLMAANLLQQQHSNQAGVQAENFNQQQEMVALLEQQLQQQVYATVKRGCPRPPRLCDLTIYQCPNQQQNHNHHHVHQQQEPSNQQQTSNITQCCNNNIVQQQSQQENINNSSMDNNQQQNIYYQQFEQQQQSDYQQLRPPIKLD